ncbi:MAG: YfhO family protein, partial [Ruminococcus sp.]|nr:YfhO family protein [Ruminococcus sp.]
MENTNKKAEKTAVKASKFNYENFRKSKFADIVYDKGVLYFFLSFIIPFVIMLIAFHRNDIHMLWFTDGKWQETGAQQFLVVDLWHQYFPFFRVLREKLLTGGSFLYSWKNGMGTNFLALIAYYA